MTIALVTGASSGIGQAIALRLARDGYHILVHFNRNHAGAEETFDGIKKTGGSAEVIQFDVKDRAAIDAALSQRFSNQPWPEILVNNAGLHRDNLTGMMSDDEFSEVLFTNTFGPFYLMRSCVKHMIRHRAGCIVNIASLAGQTGNPGQINYSASKAALIAMTRTLSSEVGSRGIRVNAVAPGLIETEMIQNIPQLEDFKGRIPLRRFGTADEVAGVVSFLCSKDAAYVTGQTIGVNGGLLPS
jgi:3-oxoacyl-[acyl-carrier protein] reductase